MQPEVLYPSATASAEGDLTVIHDPVRKRRVLINAGTRHGMQHTDPEREGEPTGYYDASGPLGDVFAGWSAGASRVGIIGLGAGTMAAYARPGQRFTFFEIDPRVVQIARDPRLFTFLARCRGACDVVVGDGREGLERADDAAFDLVAVDAFVDASIPAHMMGLDALRLYRRKLAPDGLVVYHLGSNGRQLPEIGALAASAGMVAIARRDADPSPEESERGKARSCWAVLAPELALVPWLRDDARWSVVEAAA